MLVSVLLFAVGLVLLIKGGAWFVDGATGIAKRFHLPAIVVGATVQLCLESCMFKATEVDGYAYFNTEVTDGYKVQILTVPEGYTCNPEEVIYLEAGQTELTLTVTKNG